MCRYHAVNIPGSQCKTDGSGIRRGSIRDSHGLDFYEEIWVR
jgi:hypothetical protein